MKLVDPVKIANGVYQLRVFRMGVTIIVDGDKIVLVDAGPRGSLRFIDAGLSSLGFSLPQVRLVVLTHYHPDHSGGIASLVESTSATVASHRIEAKSMNEGGEHCSPFRDPSLARLTMPLLRPLFGGPFRVDCPLEDGDRLPMEREVKVVHTPGHTPGSMCLYMPLEKVLIVGDALQYRFRRLSLPASAVTQDRRQARDSLKRLIDLDFDVVCFSHFPPLRRNARATLRRLLDRTEP